MAENVNVPKVGKVDKKVIVPIVAVAVAFVGYRYWKARQDVGGEPVDPGYEDMSGGLGPGQTRPNNDYGLPDDDNSGATTGGFRGTTNSQWSEYVTDRLQQDGRWGYSVIAVALGNFLSDRPLSSDQQDIVRAAIGIAGNPPVGYHSIVPGGNTAITVAPTGVAATGTAPDKVRVSFIAVAGAASYNVYLNGSIRGTGASTTVDITGLSPGTSYSVQVAAVSASGQLGPKSSTTTVKTPGAAIGKASQPRITVNTGGGRVTFATSAIPYATGYDWFLNGKIVNHTGGPACTYIGLKVKARYSPGASVRAAGPGSPGPVSITKSFTTK